MLQSAIAVVAVIVRVSATIPATRCTAGEEADFKHLLLRNHRLMFALDVSIVSIFTLPWVRQESRIERQTLSQQSVRELERRFDSAQFLEISPLQFVHYVGLAVDLLSVRFQKSLEQWENFFVRLVRLRLFLTTHLGMRTFVPGRRSERPYALGYSCLHAV